jgi:hypothetical protein
MENCVKCKYWDGIIEDQLFQTTKGLCRKKPPEYINGSGRWPLVGAFDWCGEFTLTENKPKEK